MTTITMKGREDGKEVAKHLEHGSLTSPFVRSHMQPVVNGYIPSSGAYPRDRPIDQTEGRIAAQRDEPHELQEINEMMPPPMRHTITEAGMNMNDPGSVLDLRIESLGDAVLRVIAFFIIKCQPKYNSKLPPCGKSGIKNLRATQRNPTNAAQPDEGAAINAKTKPTIAPPNNRTRFVMNCFMA